MTFTSKMEIWKEITYAPNYEISNLGVVRRKDGYVMKCRDDCRGYLEIKLTTDDGIVRKKLHQILADHFIPNPNNYTEIDHLDRKRFNNSLENLRWVSRSINNHNREITGEIPYRGVRMVKNNNTNPYRAEIQHNGKRFHLGCFDTAEKAAKAYNDKCIELYGEFATLNKIPEEKNEKEILIDNLFTAIKNIYLYKKNDKSTKEPNNTTKT